MVRARRQPLCSLQRWPLLLTAIFIALTVAAQSSQQTSPTNSQDAQTIDQTWQRASSKYDSERSKILDEVHRQANDGPYRADWQSLQKYEVPDWYKDAKFGIFIHWACIQCLPSEANGIRAICSGKARTNTSTTSALMARRLSLATRISSPCSGPSISIQPLGRISSKKLERSTSFRSSSITTALPCTTAAFPTGRLRKW